MKESAAQRKAKLAYRSGKRKQIQLDYSIEEFDRIKAHCEALKTPVATWCKGVISEAMEKRQD